MRLFLIFGHISSSWETMVLCIFAFLLSVLVGDLAAVLESGLFCERFEQLHGQLLIALGREGAGLPLSALLSGLLVLLLPWQVGSGLPQIRVISPSGSPLKLAL